MSKIVIYSTPSCPYCVRAKSLLTEKGYEYEEIDISKDAKKMDAMIVAAGGQRTVPQIFAGTRHIGGYDALAALETQDALDNLLKAQNIRPTH